ncbi:MAG: hypothetical protein IIA17_05570 [candidate division Zixibacteria bacterium]|nr:hypothetical protein [candidate division Zixibacteria bacterium]
MPCKDITDHLRIRLDTKDRVSRYALRKLSCGGAVGNQSMIIDWLENKQIEDILSADIGQFLDQHRTDDEIEEYLLIKHFLAVRAGLSMYVGRESGAVKNYCQVEAIRSSDSGTEILAHIAVEGMTDEISACGRCGKT